MEARALQSAQYEVYQYLSSRWTVDRGNDQAFRFRHVTRIGIPSTGICWINPSADALAFCLFIEGPAGDGNRAQMTEMLNRVNGAMPTGAFTYDFEHGGLRYRTALFFSDVPLTRKIIENLLESSLQFVDEYMHGLIHVMMGASADAGAQSAAEDDARAPEGPGESFEDYIASYLHLLFYAVGLKDATREEIAAFQQHLEATMGSQYAFGGYDGVPREHRNEKDLRAIYESKGLQLSPNAQGKAMVLAFAGEIRRRRARAGRRS